MTRGKHTPTALCRRTAAVAAIALVLGLGACSGDDQPDGGSGDAGGEASSSGTDGSGSDGQNAPGTDQSSALFAVHSTPRPVGATSRDGRKLEVLEVRSSASGTRLVFRISSPDTGFTDMDARVWTEHPRLVDGAGSTAYEPVTLTQPAYGDEDEQRLCVCTGQDAVDAEPRPQHVLYEVLPEDVTTVDVEHGDFDPVTVPVTR